MVGYLAQYQVFVIRLQKIPVVYFESNKRLSDQTNIFNIFELSPITRLKVVSLSQAEDNDDDALSVGKEAGPGN